MRGSVRERMCLPVSNDSAQQVWSYLLTVMVRPRVKLALCDVTEQKYLNSSHCTTSACAWGPQPQSTTEGKNWHKEPTVLRRARAVNPRYQEPPTTASLLRQAFNLINNYSKNIFLIKGFRQNTHVVLLSPIHFIDYHSTKGHSLCSSDVPSFSLTSLWTHIDTAIFDPTETETRPQHSSTAP